MADFVAILKKTIEGQGVTSAEMRARVYARARHTIEQKLAALTPTPTFEQKARQMKALDDAISTVEQVYATQEAPAPIAAKIVDPLEEFISAAEASRNVPPPRKPDARPIVAVPPPYGPKPVSSPVVASAAMAAAPGIEAAASKIERQPSPQNAGRPTGRSTLLWLALGALLAAGASYGAYVKKDEISAYYKSMTAPAQPEVKKVVTTSVKPADPAKAEEKQPETAAAAAPAAKTEAGEEKFTQRLTEDGKEVDTGPSTAAAEVGEGATVAQVTTPPGVKPAAPEAGAAPETPAAPEAAPAQALPVGQKAVFYEEKTGTEDGTVDQGGVVWSVVQDSPGADQPAEPAIRGEIDIPEKSLKLKFTIKRNGDKTLPASHIIEMAFSVPADFKGGSVDGVQRVTFKDTEQAPGNPLVGVPANFGDGFFLIALTDEKSAVENNLALMSRQSWIDIPLTYKSGRRALISIEKGIPGDKVFQEVFKAWTAKAAG